MEQQRIPQSMMRGCSKDVKDLLRKLHKRGLSTSLDGKNHIKITWPDGTYVARVSMGVSPFNRGLQNAVKEMRKRGVAI